MRATGGDVRARPATVLDADGVIRRPEHDSATSTVLAPSFHALLDRYVDDWAG